MNRFCIGILHEEVQQIGHYFRGYVLVVKLVALSSEVAGLGGHVF